MNLLESIAFKIPGGEPEHRSLGAEQPVEARNGMHAATEDQKWPFRRPHKARSTEIARHPGDLFFDCFYSAKRPICQEQIGTVICGQPEGPDQDGFCSGTRPLDETRTQTNSLPQANTLSL